MDKKPIEMNMELSGNFRQCVMKLANTYEPNIELTESHDNQHQLFEEFAKKISQDFSDQLYPLFLDALYKKFDQQLN